MKTEELIKTATEYSLFTRMCSMKNSQTLSQSMNQIKHC